jgi:hypothetical protein
MPKKSALLLVGWFLALSFLDPVPSHAQTWDFLGHARIDVTRDHQQIRVTRRDGLFSSIQLRVSGDAIFFDRVIVHFNNGISQALPIRDRISAGARNNVLDFHGERRAIESVELWYFQELWEHNPIVIVYGS